MRRILRRAVRGPAIEIIPAGPIVPAEATTIKGDYLRTSRESDRRCKSATGAPAVINSLTGRSAREFGPQLLQNQAFPYLSLHPRAHSVPDVSSTVARA